VYGGVAQEKHADPPAGNKKRKRDEATGPDEAAGRSVSEDGDAGSSSGGHPHKYKPVPLPQPSAEYIVD
jgi:hypothetical protein